MAEQIACLFLHKYITCPLTRKLLVKFSIKVKDFCTNQIHKLLNSCQPITQILTIALLNPRSLPLAPYYSVSS